MTHLPTPLSSQVVPFQGGVGQPSQAQDLGTVQGRFWRHTAFLRA